MALFMVCTELTEVYLFERLTPLGLLQIHCLLLVQTEFLKRSFSYSGALLWNSLSGSLRSMSSTSSFKKGIDEFYTDSNNLSI